ncbi:sulfatase [Candidatus Leptofilum sp.]|uniref:sulfatase n=1 Tax=Candidatus Leptofilum sp. TaxID=3241576 RepID=UPI003B5B19D5
MTKPNILLLTIDTLRADTLGYAGYKKPITPNIDKLASQGIRFTQAITPGSWTQAAFPGIITSTYACMYGGCLGRLSPERPSPVKIMGDEGGYETAAFSTSPLLSRTYGYDRKFQRFNDLNPGEKSPKIRGIKGGQALLRQPIVHQIAKLFGQNWRPPKLYATAAELNDAAMPWLASIGEPFKAWLHYMDVHWPYHLEDELTKPKDIAEAWADLSHLHEVNWYGAPVSPEQKARYIRLYEEAIAYTDAQIGRLMDFLDETGLAENTIIVLVSDHGEEFLERRHWGHVELNLYDEILKVPMLMRIPGVSGNQVIGQQVSTMDIMPTLLELAGCRIPEKVLGKSLVPLWDGDPADYGVEVAIGERWRDTSHMIAVRTEEYKYIWDDAKPNEPLLFDLRRDPEERHNIAAEHPDVVQALHRHVEAQLERMRSTAPAEMSKEPVLDEEIVERLRGLGYVE